MQDFVSDGILLDRDNGYRHVRESFRLYCTDSQKGQGLYFFISRVDPMMFKTPSSLHPNKLPAFLQIPNSYLTSVTSNLVLKLAIGP